MFASNGGYYMETKSCEVDHCIASEILDLWNHGIVTMGCCCGHGVNEGIINVLPQDVDMMLYLGYEQLDVPEGFCKETFRPKSKHIDGFNYYNMKIITGAIESSLPKYISINTIRPDESYTFGNKASGGIEISNLDYEPRTKRKFNIGYDSDEPCDVCGKVGDCQSDSWFCYTVCDEHSEMSPYEVSKIRQERNR